MGNLPAVAENRVSEKVRKADFKKVKGQRCVRSVKVRRKCSSRHTLGQTRTQETRNLLDQAVGSEEGIVLAGELLDELLVLVKLLQVVGGHGVDTAVLGTVDIVLVTQNADGHVGARDRRQLQHRQYENNLEIDQKTTDTNGTAKSLIALRIVVLQADLELNGF